MDWKCAPCVGSVCLFLYIGWDVLKIVNYFVYIFRIRGDEIITSKYLFSGFGDVNNNKILVDICQRSCGHWFMVPGIQYSIIIPRYIKRLSSDNHVYCAGCVHRKKWRFFRPNGNINQQYTQCPSWFFILLERYKLFDHRQWARPLDTPCVRLHFSSR